MPITTQTPTTVEARASQADDEREYGEKQRDFRIHAMVATVSTILLFVVNWYINAMSGITGEIWAWWSIWVLVGWGFTLMIHRILVMLARPVTVPTP